jgi:hypothetical protein
MRTIDAFMCGIEYLITARLEFHDQIVILGIDKLASESSHGLSIPITPASIAAVRIAPVAEIDRRFSGAKIRRRHCLFAHSSHF